MAAGTSGNTVGAKVNGSGVKASDTEDFCWSEALAELTGSAASPSINIGAVCCDRQVALGQGARIGVRWLGRGQERRDLSFQDLSDLSGRAASVLTSLGLQSGDTVAVLLGRVPELYISALGIWKAGGVYCPLFSAFGPGPIKARLELGRARFLITTEDLFTRKVVPNLSDLPDLQHVVLVGEDGRSARAMERCSDFYAQLKAAAPMAPVATRQEDPAFMHFTSGTTGTPKGAVQPHRAVLAHLVTGRTVFGLVPDDVFWCTADPGWVTSTAYGIIAPLVCCATTLVDEADVEPRRWYGILADERVTAWYTTPTSIRTMMRYGAALARSYRENSLRVAASVGEPLNVEAVQWGQKALGVPFLDTWWQTETGAIVIANHRNCVSKPGSMGQALPGVETALVRCESGVAHMVTEPDTVGELAIHSGWPSLFCGYLGEYDRAEGCFRGDWYLTGDLVKRDAEGFFWFVGRADDMIKSGGLRIGPFEVEASLMDHPAVAEIGVVSKPDLLLREVPVAFVSLNPGFESGDALRLELLSFARQELGAGMAPREIHFVAELPKTNTGKIMRRMLKAKASGESDEADIPTLQPCPGRFDDE
ncbi:Acyl-coenzyme A synthetase/AMP-(Fatty) acid ligase [Candidatus Terasakiella magnetica]|nr:Acyl-coenzyme A synthetase/AMP-(Fatty) acid ligase [Candidatus Terasakiella magnetica]